jgi:hypothetical protein
MSMVPSSQRWYHTDIIVMVSMWPAELGEKMPTLTGGRGALQVAHSESGLADPSKGNRRLSSAPNKGFNTPWVDSSLLVTGCCQPLALALVSILVNKREWKSRTLAIQGGSPLDPMPAIQSLILAR